MSRRGLYEFKREDALRFANEQMATVKQRGNELQFKHCPYCGSKGRGDQYSFSINLNNGLYKCMRASCGAHGNMIQLARDFGFDLGNDMEYYEPRKHFREFKRPERKIEPKSAAVQYLESRGISEAVTKEFEITVRADDNNVLIFPFYDVKGEGIQLIKYRAIKVNANGSKEWAEANCRPVLFGMNHCDADQSGRLVITEGQIDSLTLAECGILNAVSVPGGKNNFTWVPHCWDFVNQFSEIVVFGDYEHGEISLLDEITKRFGKNMIIKHVRPEDYKDCKDANDILRKYGREQITACVNNAQIVPMKILKDLADVKAPNDIKKLRTGLRCLDNILHGGLSFGLYHIIAGKRGNGKSTLASQIFAQALDQGYTCMAYSGELNDYNFKFWLDSQLAGTRNIIEDPRTIGREYHDYMIAASAQDRINEWYRGRCFIYDNTILKGEDVTTRLLDVVDEAVRRYGVKVVLLDNLMTAIHKEDYGNKTEYEKQGKFTDELAAIAQQTGALIILVAHKRKGTVGGVDGSDDVAGNSQITNYAGAVISYDRYTKQEIKDAEERGEKLNEDCRKLIIEKNRLYGSINTDGFCMNFDHSCRRIWGSESELTYQYGWEREESNFEDIEQLEIPFS